MRKAGILMGIPSLPSDYGIGCFSKEAYEFVDFLKKSNQKYWQILPIGPTSFGDSPYQSFSSFAGNPYFIDLNTLIDEGVLSEEDCKSADFGTDKTQIDYGKLYNERYKLLHKAYLNTDLDTAKYRNFIKKNGFWLDDYAEFMALKDKNGGKAWNEWEIKTVNNEKEIEFWKYIQYKFFEQWYRLKNYANENGIEIIGDIPIYVSYDSVEVWKHPELFQLDRDGKPINVAGCPPDGFSATGQLWGNPLYRWETHQKDGFSWWISRISYALSLYDVLRIDHFRGFCEYYSIPYGEDTARNGKWEEAPGRELFRTIEKKLGKQKIIAEDLGFITNSVRQLLSECGFMGMKVFEFAFDSRDDNGTSVYMPHNYPQKCVAYTATHDNEPVSSWFMQIQDAERKQVRDYLCDYNTPDRDIAIPFISRIMQSSAEICIIPIQDYMKKGSESRINTPETVGINWRWRVNKGELTDALSDLIASMTKRYGR